MLNRSVERAQPLQGNSTSTIRTHWRVNERTVSINNIYMNRFGTYYDVIIQKRECVYLK